MNIEGPMNQWHLDYLKRNKKLFVKTLNDTTTRRDKLKEERIKLEEQFQKELDAVAFYAGIILNINEDIKEIEKAIKKEEDKVMEDITNELS